jgi:Tol biopolymer transport system component
VVADEPLLNVAAALADGKPLDWESAAQSITNDEDRRLLAELQFIAGVTRPPCHDSSDLPVDTWGPLKIIEHIGRGTFGDVYRAWDSRLDREVALKILRRKERNDATHASTVIEEGRLLARVRHPNVVTVYGAERVNGRVGVWMEFVHGKSLEEELRDHGPFDVDRVIKIALDLSGALSTVHRAGLIHGDVKAQNVLCDREGRFVLTDFGAGIELNERPDGAACELAGTPLCIAPEVLVGQPASPRTDLYSLGVLLYHLLTGTYPVCGRSLKEVREAHADGTRVPLHQARPDLRQDLVRVIDRALDPDPRVRYESVDMFHGELIGLVESAVNARGAVATSRSRQRVQWPWVLAFSTALVVTLGVLLSNRESSNVSPVWRSLPLTTYPGSERNPALAPDGQQVAFSWDGPEQNNFDIYVKPIGAVALRRLTTDPAEDESPAWAPDGGTIAFLRRRNGDRLDLLLTPASGGPEHSVAQLASSFRLPSLAWSPDGNWLAVTERERNEDNESLFLVSARTGEKRRLTEPPHGFSGDFMPAFSPDGRAIVFARLSGWSASEIYLVPLSGDRPAGSARALTRDGRWAISPVWTRDGRSIFYLSGDSGGRLAIWKFAVSVDTPPERISELDGDAFQLSLGTDLVYSRETGDTNIWRANIGISRSQPTSADVLIASTRYDWQPRFSPDGKRIAFGSTRSGAREVWIADADGGNAVQMTSFSGPHVGFMNWSPDNQRLVFHARPEGQADLFTVTADRHGSPVRLTTHPADDVQPSYSHDGRWTYFASLRSGQWEAWKMPAAGGNAVQITNTGGVEMPLESPDGESVYFCIPGIGIWKVPANGGDAHKVVGSIAPECAFAVTADGLYYAAATGSNQGSIRFLSFATGESRPIVASDHPLGMGLTLSPDRRVILFTRVDHAGSDLMRISNFAMP